MKAVLTGCWRLIQLYFIWLGVLVTALIFLILIVLSTINFDSLTTGRQLITPPGDVLIELELSGRVFERFDYRGPTTLFDLLGDSDNLLPLSKLRQQIKRLERIDSIQGVLLHIKPNFSIHHDHAMDLLDELKNLARKKSVYVFGATLRGGANYLTVGAQEIVLTPGGHLELPSPAMAQLLLGQAMERFGVGVDVMKAGDYKNFFFHLDQVDAKNKRQLLGVYDSFIHIFSDNMKRIRLHRQTHTALTPDLIDEWFQQAYYHAPEALEQHLITQISHLTPFQDKLASTTDLTWHKYQDIDWTELSRRNNRHLLDRAADQGEPPPPVSPADDSHEAPADEQDSSWLLSLLPPPDEHGETQDSLGYLNFSGSIMLTGDDSAAARAITARQVQEQVDVMIKHQHVRGVVVRINSPGGSVLASELIWSEIKRLSDAKPVVAYVDQIAASGGYYMAAAADQIVARATAITGSIGVLLVRPHVAGLAKKYGITMDLTTRQRHTDLLDPTQSLSPTTRDYLASSLQQSYELFLDRVAQGRDMTSKEVHLKLAQGRIWTGQQAYNNALIDRIGNRKTAFNIVKELAGLDPTQAYPVEFARKHIPLLKTCLSSISQCLRLLRATSSWLGQPQLGLFNELLWWRYAKDELLPSHYAPISLRPEEWLQAHVYVAMPQH